MGYFYFFGNLRLFLFILNYVILFFNIYILLSLQKRFEIV